MHKGGETIKSFTKLKAWQEGHELVALIYEFTGQFPKKEDFVLQSQMRRSAISVTSNLAEGFGYYSKKMKKRFYLIARGSLIELQSQLLIANKVKYISQNDLETIQARSAIVNKLISGLIKKFY